MTTDDVHDLFGRDEDDESDSSAERLDDESDERSDASDSSVEWDELSSLEDEGSTADQAWGRLAEPTTEASGAALEEDRDEFEPAVSGATSSEEPGEDSADEFDPAESTMSFEGSVGDDASEFEVAGSTTSSEGSVEDDTDEHESADSTTMFSEEAVEDASGEFEPPGSAPGGSAEDDSSERETTGPTSPAVDADDAGEAESTTIPSGDDTEPPGVTASREESVSEEEGTESAETTFSPEGAAVEERDESDSDEVRASTVETSADGASTDEWAAGGTTKKDSSPSEISEPTASADPFTSADGSTATDASVTDGSTTADHDELETASPDHSGSVASKAAVGEGMADGERTTVPASGSNRLPTGIDELDRAMGGGIPPGRLVVLVADPGVQSELIVDSVLAQRDTLFVTTDRPDWEVMKDIEPGIGSGEVEVRDHTPNSLLSGLDSLLDELGTSSNLVLDSVNELELVPRKRYRIFLSDVKRRLFDTGSIGLFTGVTVGHESARDLTLRRADIVLRLETRTTDREIENRLSVPKFRGGAALTETVKLLLTDQVEVDPSWNDGR